jgi:hypothetical protein
MKLVERIYPKDAKIIKFNFVNNPDFGMINLYNHKEEINTIENCDSVISKYKNIHIYFPLYDNFYVEECNLKNENGWTFKNIVKEIYKTGLKAGAYDIKNNPGNYKMPIDKHDFIGSYGITNKDIQIKGNKIYVNVNS